MKSDVYHYATLKQCGCCGKVFFVKRHYHDEATLDKKEKLFCFWCVVRFVKNETVFTVPNIS